MDEVLLLEVRDLRVRFGEVTAVDGASFTLRAGEILGVVGESGSGKTQMLLAVLGLVDAPGAVLEGSVRLRGRELLGLAPAALRGVRGRDVAMIFQDAMSALTPVYTIGWQIVEQIRAHTNLSRRAAWARAEALLAETGFADPHAAARRYPHQLSGGMRQRAMIAMALSCDPALLIADEPTTALDVTVQAQILALMERLRDRFGSAVVLVTHDMGVVAETAERVLVMYGGRVVERGMVTQVLRAPRHPYTRGLLAAIPPVHGEKPRRLEAIAEPSRAPGTGCAFAPRCAEVFARCAAVPPLYPVGEGAAACFRLAPP